jgi:protoporphyrinogen oxidase
MLRWAIRAAAAASYKSEVIRESGQATRKSKDAMTKFSRAQREKDMDKKMDYLSEGMSDLAEAISHNSNATEPLAEMSFVASLLAESIQKNLDEQTKDIVTKIKA